MPGTQFSVPVHRLNPGGQLAQPPVKGKGMAPLVKTSSEELLGKTSQELTLVCPQSPVEVAALTPMTKMVSPTLATDGSASTALAISLRQACAQPFSVCSSMESPIKAPRHPND